MAGLVVATLLLALGTCMLAIGVLWRRRRARGLAIALEVVCLFGTAILLLLPIGFNRGPVSLMVNVALPIALVVLLRKDGEAFATDQPDARAFSERRLSARSASSLVT
jgi:hypothetical protein